jgi:type IV pilus assembly protein PilA
MTVVLIIAILLAVAIPSLLGARKAANARPAQSDLRNALIAEQVQWTNAQAFSATVSTMSGIEPNLHWTAAGSVNAGMPNSVLVTVDTHTAGTDGTQWVELTAMGKDKNCWSIAQVNVAFGTVPAGTYYTKSATTANACTARGAPTGAPTNGSATSGSGANWYLSL